MNQVITLKLKLHEPTKVKRDIYQTMADCTTAFAKRYLTLDKDARPKTSRDAKEYSDLLPSAVLNQAIRDIRSKRKAKHFRRLWPSFNNQNFRVEKEQPRSGGAAWKASFPTLEKRIGVPIVVVPYQERYLEMLISGGARQGSARLVKCGREWYIHLSLTVAVKEKPNGKIMGIDLGLITLLVASINNQTLFFSGSRLAYIRRRLNKLRRKLQKAGAHRALIKLGDKEHRWITDVNHKISCVVVEFAKLHGVGMIRMEDLTGVRWTKNQRRKQRKDPGRSLHKWAFYQLQQFIEYKATLAGITVEYANRDNTSRTCSRCGEVKPSRSNSRWFTCPRCKKQKHVDANAADNIAHAISGLAA